MKLNYNVESDIKNENRKVFFAIKFFLLLIFISLIFLRCEICTFEVVDKKRGEDLFFKCLKSVPKGPDATNYNDMDEVVEQCRLTAYEFSKERVCDK